ncbi:MAG: hypothetical protein EPO21_13195 [Chloroflexota bacterium]|nr:MAG: hypothetical protein EPO21_13195 [Chloroflexota bacterium]
MRIPFLGSSTKSKSGDSPKKRGRPTRQMAAERRRERLKEAQARLQEMQIQEEIKRLQEEGFARAGKPVSIDELAALNRQLRPLGLGIMPLEGDGGAAEGALSQVRDLLDTQAGAALMSQLGQLFSGKAAPAAAVSEAERPAELPAATLAPPPPTDVAGARAEVPEESTSHQEQPMNFVTRLVINNIVENLNGKNPEQAAQWLMGQGWAKPVVQQIVDNPDEQIPALLASLEQQMPETGAVLNWLRSQPEWFMETVRAVRRFHQDKAGTATPRRSGLGL